MNITHCTAIFIYKIHGKSAAPSIFLPKFRKPSHWYPTQFSHLNYVKLTPKLNKCKYGISYRGSFIWNNFLSTTDKKITDTAKFKSCNQVKISIVNLRHYLCIFLHLLLHSSLLKHILFL